MEPNLLLESYLRELHLPAFLRHYRKVAEDAAQAHLSYDRYLLALAEQKVTQRETNRQARLIKAAHFPILKELADFDFTCVPSLHQQQVLELAQGSYIPRLLCFGRDKFGSVKPSDPARLRLESLWGSIQRCTAGSAAWVVLARATMARCPAFRFYGASTTPCLAKS